MLISTSGKSGSAMARMRIVAINDVYDLANLPRLQTFLSKLSTKPSAVVLAGDFLSPSTLSSIDGGRGMVATLRAMGLTHASLGNHEQDLRLDALRERLSDLSKSAVVINSNVRVDDSTVSGAEWINTVTQPYSVIESPCNKVRVALLGLLTDEPGVFRDNTFKGIPVGNVLDTYSNIYSDIMTSGNDSDTSGQENDNNDNNPIANFVLPLTHSSLVRDKELAEHMLSTHSNDNFHTKSLIIGGHEHEPYDELVSGPNNSSVRILKTGMDANAASLIDLYFEMQDDNKAALVDIESDLVEMKSFEPSIVVQKIVDNHMSVVNALEEEDIIDGNIELPPGIVLSSERTRFEQTTAGGMFCQMIKEEMEVDVALINGASIKGGETYYNGGMSYAQLKKELPFPTKMVVVPMERWELERAISYSRTFIPDDADPDAEEIPRRGYLQVDRDYEDMDVFGFPDEVLRVALPRNLMKGFCKIKPLIEFGERLEQEGMFPGPDDYVPAIDLIVRHACKNRWFQIAGDFESFHEFDTNNDGVLDREEIKNMMKTVLGHEPADFLVDDMIASIDSDENGVIDKGEFSFLLATIERNHPLKKF